MLWWGIIFYTDTYLCRWWWNSFENDDAADEENFRWFIDTPAKMILMMLSSLSRMMLLKNTLLVKGECWNNVIAKSILIIIWYIIYRINPHCGLIMSVIVLGPNLLLWIGQQTIIIGRIRSRPHKLIRRPRNIINVGLPTQMEKSALLVKRHFTHARTCIHKGG